MSLFLFTPKLFGKKSAKNTQNSTIRLFFGFSLQKMVKLRKHIAFLAILLIPVYLLVLGNSIRNRHTHVLPNGVVITHSHPFTDADGLPVKHSHTRNQIVFFQLFTFDFFDSAPEVFVVSGHHLFQREINAVYTEQFSINTSSTAFLRGPPVS